MALSRLLLKLKIVKIESRGCQVADIRNRFYLSQAGQTTWTKMLRLENLSSIKISLIIWQPGTISLTALIRSYFQVWPQPGTKVLAAMLLRRK